MAKTKVVDTSSARFELRYSLPRPLPAREWRERAAELLRAARERLDESTRAKDRSLARDISMLVDYDRLTARQRRQLAAANASRANGNLGWIKGQALDEAVALVRKARPHLTERGIAAVIARQNDEEAQAVYMRIRRRRA